MMDVTIETSRYYLNIYFRDCFRIITVKGKQPRDILYMLHNYISKLCIIMDILLVTMLNDTSHFDMLYCYPR